MAVGKKQRTSTLHVDDWPTADRRAWENALKPTDPFTKTCGGAVKLKASTQDLIASGYGRYLWWLQQNGLLQSDAMPADRIGEQNLFAYMQYLQAGSADFTVATRLQQLGMAMKALAPSSNHATILTASYRLRTGAKPTRNKRDRVQSSADTASLGFSLLEQAETDRHMTPVMRAKRHRDALLILLLSYRANRNANLASIAIGKHLAVRGEGLWLSFDATEMKAGRPYESPVPRELVQPILRYIKEFRPILLSCSKKNLPPTDALWISCHGTQMTKSAIALRVKAYTKAEFGVSMPPHFFRDALATTQAIEAPQNVSDTMALLSHLSGATAEKHYNQSNGITARRRHGEAVDQWRASNPEPNQHSRNHLF